MTIDFDGLPISIERVVPRTGRSFSSPALPGIKCDVSWPVAANRTQAELSTSFYRYKSIFTITTTITYVQTSS